MAQSRTEMNSGMPVDLDSTVVTRANRQRVAAPNAVRRARKGMELGSEHPQGKETRGAQAEEAKREAMNAIRRTPSRARAVPREKRTERTSDPYVVPEEIKARFVQVGKSYHFPDGARAFTDLGTRLTSPSENAEVIKSLIAIAQVRGWSSITVSGTERFRKEAWSVARLAGLEVRGYSPTEFEQGRVVRALARKQAAAEHSVPSAARAAASRSTEGEGSTAFHVNPASGTRAASRERQRALQVGRLVEHGPAPYLHDPHNPMSYFVRIETRSGERDIWGVDLQRAMRDSLTRPQIGDEIGVRALRRDAVKVLRLEHDADGRVTGKRPHETHRNAWIVEKRDFFRERSQAARIVRDPSVDRRAAVKAHPQLLGTYLQLQASELAAKRIQDPEDKQRFVASVRTALADSVARGEPLATVPLKKEAELRREPHARTAPAGPEVLVTPVR